jgi:hypothetical protein
MEAVMGSLVNSIKNLFSSAQVNAGWELQSLKREGKNTRGLPAPEPERSILLLPSLFLPRFFIGFIFLFQAFRVNRGSRRRFSQRYPTS